jgi:hypothetical protein
MEFVTIRDITSGDMHRLPGNTPAVEISRLNDADRQEAIDCGGLDAELDDVSVPLQEFAPGEQCLVVERNHSHGMDLWWLSEVM